jgi:hypothetical protein
MKHVLAVAVVVSALAAGCGGVESEPNLAAAAERTEATGSSRFTVTVLGAGPAGGTRCEGLASYTDERVRAAFEELERSIRP